MLNNNYEYTGKPTLLQKIFRAILLIGIIALMLWFANNMHSLFTDYEAGKNIRVPSFIFLFYKIGGKWLVTGILMAITAVIIWGGIKQFMQDWTKQ